MREMVKSMLKSDKIFSVILIIGVVVGVTALPYAINLFFRLLLVGMENPLEVIMTSVLLLGFAALYETMKGR